MSNLREETTPHHRLLSFRTLVFVLLFVVGTTDHVPADTYRVYLNNKGISPFIKGSELYAETAKLLSPRCLQRRSKVLVRDSLFSLTDAPLYQPYLDDIIKSGARIDLQLRWKNYVVVECDSVVMKKLKVKPYVKAITSTGEKFSVQAVRSVAEELHVTRTSMQSILDTACGAFRYGPSYVQNAMLHTHELHALGEIGSNALLGILDNGFRWPAHDCFNNMRRVNEYDFIFRDSSTANDSLDVGSQDGHGTNTLSVIAGYEPDSLIGTAPGVGVIMAKTEDMRFERRIEEDNYAAAIEWMEAQGVDVTSASIGYDRFDSTQVSYSFSDLDGFSTIVDMAVNRATALGMVCCSAAGNNGGTSRTIISPGDADSSITVGAFDDDSLHVAKFTSKGPNASNRLKPDLATLGTNVVVCNLTTRQTIGRATGTSFATPAMAGGIALLLSQFPEMKPWELRRLLYENSSQSASPDTAVGYGLPNLMRAAERYGIVVSPLLSYNAPRYQYFIHSIRSAYPLERATLYVRRDGGMFEAISLQSTSVLHQYLCRVTKPEQSPVIDYYLEVQDSVRTRRLPPSGFSTLNFGDSKVPCGLDPVDFPSDVPEVAHVADPGLPTAIAFGTPTLQLPIMSAAARLRVKNALGQDVLNIELNTSSHFIPMSSLVRGYYVIELSTSDHAGASIIQPLMVY